MASNDIVGIVYAVVPPATTYATPDARAGGSTPAESFPVWDFDDTTAEHLDFHCVLSPTYAGGGLTVRIYWSATSATTNSCVWNAAIRRINDDGEDIDTSQTYDFNAVTATTANVSGEVKYSEITFTSGADMDSLAAGEQFVLRVKRDASNGSDNMTGDAELHSVTIRET
jgi:hypothetical protein